MFNGLVVPKEWRYERKFVVSNLTKREVETIITYHPAMFSKIYTQRSINNVYLDSLNLQSYYDNIDGMTHRIKVRVRWYGNLFGEIGKPVLELKIKNGFLGAKISYPVKPFSIATKFDSQILFDSLCKSELPEALMIELKSFKPVLLNHYTRTYFQSADKDYRITVDTGLTTYRVNYFRNLLLDKISHNNEIIVELKYKEEADHRAHYISNGLPFRLTKSSKYVDGVERLH